MIVYLCLIALFVYGALATATKDAEWAHIGSDNISGYLMGKVSTGNIMDMRGSDSSYALRTFTGLLLVTQDIGKGILSSAAFRGAETGFLPVRADIALVGGRMAVLIRNWGYGGMYTDWPLSPLGLIAPVQSRNDLMPRYNSSSFIGGRGSSFVSYLQTAAISMVPKPLQNTTALWGSLTAHMSEEGLTTAHNNHSLAIEEI